MSIAIAIRTMSSEMVRMDIRTFHMITWSDPVPKQQTYQDHPKEMTGLRPLRLSTASQSAHPSIINTPSKMSDGEPSRTGLVTSHRSLMNWRKLVSFIRVIRFFFFLVCFVSSTMYSRDFETLHTNFLHLLYTVF